MKHSALISICIPAYKRISDLKQLLDSISEQTFKDFEVVVTDDSPDDTVRVFLDSYKPEFKLLYYKNDPALGTPENWNEGIRKATGAWIKIMHDDDYFTSVNSLQFFVDAIRRNPAAELFFGDFVFEDLENKSRKVIRCNWFDLMFLKLSPYHMLRRNYFGNPSCILISNKVRLNYDKRLKYIVDFAYYIDLLKHHIKVQHIPEVLITVGINELQVTNYTYMNVAVQMYENHVLIEKEGSGMLKNMVAFDYFWRIYRRFNIRSIENIQPHFTGKIHPKLIRMIRFQRAIPAGLLKVGILSKLFMGICFVLTAFSAKAG